MILIIAVIIAIPLLIAAFRKNEYVISREIVINKGIHEIYDYIRFLSNMEHYNKWMMIDPDARVKKSGIDGSVGAKYAWDSDNKQVGKGEQQIIQLVPDESVDMEIRFEKPMKGISKAKFTLFPESGNATKVTWAFYGYDMPYQARLMHTLLNLQKMLGKDMQTSLSNLKTIMERN